LQPKWLILQPKWLILQPKWRISRIFYLKRGSFFIPEQFGAFLRHKSESTDYDL